MSLPLRVFECLDGEIRKVFVVTFTLEIFLAWRSKNRSAIKVKPFVATKTKTARPSTFYPILCARVREHDFFLPSKSVTDAWTFLRMKQRRRRRRKKERERERERKKEKRRGAHVTGGVERQRDKGVERGRKKERKKEVKYLKTENKLSSSSSSSVFFVFSLLFLWCFGFFFSFKNSRSVQLLSLVSRLSIGFEPPTPSPFKVRERERERDEEEEERSDFFFLIIIFSCFTSAMAESSVIEHEAKAEHVIHCFETLLCYFDNVKGPAPVFQDAYCPLFVTWKKKARVGNEEPRLRGCIGTLEPKDLHSSLGEYALISALRDRRFNPIDVKEVQSLLCTVSLLTNFERNLTWLDWEVGKHGMIIEFEDPSSSVSLSATYLPEVAQQQGWTKQECIDSLIQKAGYYGKVTEDIRRKIWLTRYQSSLCTMSYQDYIMMKESN